MREVAMNELSEVSGADWKFGFNLGFVNGEVSGTETIQEIASAGYGLVSDAYWGAREAMTGFFTWWDPCGFYNC